MKKAMALIVSIFMALTLAACGGSPSGSEASTQTTQTTQPTKAPADQSDIVVEKTQAPTTTPTEPAVPTDIGETGYCAVGIVDADAKTAKVLGNNGAVASISYDGYDPVPGAVYGFSKSGDKYTLTEATFINGSAINDPAWNIRVNDCTPAGGPDQIYTNDGTNEYLYDFTDDTVIFMRFSATEWRLVKGIDAVVVGDFPCSAYFSVMENPGEGNQLVNLVLVGNYDAAKGEIIPAKAGDTYYFDKEGFGWDKGDITIG